MNSKLATGINEQLNFEIFSSYLYVSISSYFNTENLKGCANWMYVQAQEELAHTMILYNFLHDREAHVELTGVPKPRTKWNSVIEAFKDAYSHEQSVTARINNLMDIALDVKDHATHTRLQWFISEQIEEEANVLNVIKQLELMGDSTHALFLMDKELGQRVYTPPAVSGT